MSEDRVFNQLPKLYQTRANQRLLSTTADPLFEPANVEQFQGMIGETTNVPDSTRAKTPPLVSRDGTTDLLTSAAVVFDTSGNPTSGAFFTDVFGHLKANGSPDDAEKVFECPFYSYVPPIDFDRWTNFQKYVWTGEGSAVDLAEYVVKAPLGTKLVLHVVTEDGFRETPVIVGESSVDSFPTDEPADTYREASFATGRPIYRWNGTAWAPVQIIPVDELPASTAEYDLGAALYVCRYGYKYQRIVLRHWSPGAKRFLTKTPIISRLEPSKPVTGMVWDRVNESGTRTFLEWDGGEWRIADYWCTNAVESFEPQESDDTRYMYQTVDYSQVTDPWAKDNWWVHWTDLTRIDQNARIHDQAIRPIVQLWSGIEAFDIVKTRRNQPPAFEVYKFDGTNIVAMSDTAQGFLGNGLFTFVRGTGADDTVLGQPLSWDETGEILFDLQLESKVYAASSDGENFKGYSFFKDLDTGKLHSVWTRTSATLPLINGQPVNWSFNPTHQTETSVSRRNLLTHMISVIETNSEGSGRGDNSWRWSTQDPTAGATIIDSEGSLLRLGVLMTDTRYDPVMAMRRIGFEYSRFFLRFARIMNEFFSDMSLVTPDGQWKGGDFEEACNLIIEELSNHIDPTKPFAAGMGTYTTAAGIEYPIQLPASPARIGVSPAYAPRKVTYPDGQYILGHDGSLTPVYGDDRDNVLLELENRFFNAIPASRKTETATRSSRKDGDVISVFDWAKGFKPTFKTEVAAIKNDVEQGTQPANGTIWLDLKTASVATRVGGLWQRRKINNGELIGVNDEQYIWNGFAVQPAPIFGKALGDYSYNDYRVAVRREFENWVFTAKADPGERTDYDANNKWTWNFSNNGAEGSWSGLYSRIYGTDRPHAAPWEILGYSIKPTWWETEYAVSDATADDGTKRWTSDHEIWDYIAEQEGWADTNTPIPVDEEGELIDPQTLGIVQLARAGSGNDRWHYGDDGPVERKWRRSREGRFAEAIGLYLLKPARMVEPYWSDYSFSLPNPTELANGRMLIDDELFRRPVAYGNLHGVNGTVNAGFGSWVSTAVELVGGSAETLSADLLASKTSLAWKCQGFVTSESLSVTLPSGKQIPEENVSLFIHKSKPVSVGVMSGVQIVKRGSSYEIWGYDESNPAFTVRPGLKPNANGRIHREEVISGEAGDQEFEMTTLRVGPADLSTITVTINGNLLSSNLFSFPTQNTLRLSGTLRQNATITVTSDTAPSVSGSRARRLTVGTGTYFYYIDAAPETVTYPYGTTLDGIQSVVEFLYDYGRLLTEQGWNFIEEDWLAVAARFIDWALSAKDNQIFVDVASGKKLSYTSTFGQIGDMNDDTGSSVFDIGGMPLRSVNYVRQGGTIEITSTSDHVFMVRVPVVTIQHVILFPQQTRFDDIIFDAFSGIRQRRLIVRGYRTKDWEGRFEIPGFIVDDTGKLIANLDTRAKEVTRWHDTVKGPMSNKAAEQAWSLYGWQPDDAASQIGASKEMAFDRHKRAIREKGTLPSIESFSTMKSGNDLISVRECWAWKIGEFGNGKRDLLGSVRIQPQTVVSQRMAIRFSDTELDGTINIPAFPNAAWVRRPKKDTIKLDNSITIGLVRNDAMFSRPFQWDPSAGLNEPVAFSQLDHEQATDPAYYTTGSDRVDAGLAWGEAEVGTLWWDTSRRSYVNYKNMGALDSVANWGRLAYQPVTSTAIQGGTRLVMSSTTGFVVDNVYMAVDRDGKQTPFLVQAVSSQAVDGEFITSDALEKPSSDAIIELVRGSIDVWVWTSSSVPPTLHNVWDYSLPRARSNSAPYSAHTDARGNTTYYFWTTNRDDILGGKTLSTNLAEKRLSMPGEENLTWFAVKDSSTMVIDFVQNDMRSPFDIQIQLLDNAAAVHDHWEVITESPEAKIDERVLKVLFSSIAGKDEFGRPIPSTERNAIDRIGVGRGQTVFPDIEKARATFVSSLNRLMGLIDNRTSDNFARAFSEERLGDYWQRADFGSSVSWPVLTVPTRTAMENIQDPMKGDTVTIIRAFKIGTAWKREAYEFDGIQWVIIRSEQTSAAVTDAVFDSYSTLRRSTLALSVSAFNEFVFDLLKEMLAQNPNCGWFMKTSLVDLVAPIVSGQALDVGPDEVALVDKAFSEVKPYSTKVRRLVSRNKIVNRNTDYEDVPVEIIESDQKNIGMFFDRLSCNLFDDDTWDVESLDFRAYDFQPWDMDDLGSNYWTTFKEFTSVSGQRIYQFGLANSAANYRVVAVTNQGTTTAPAHAIDLTGGRLSVRFWVSPPQNRLFRVEQVAAVVSPQLVPLSRYGTGRALSTWEHASAVTRSRLSGSGSTRAVSEDGCSMYEGCDPCDDLNGGLPGERILPITSEGVAITVTTHWTEALAGWDAAPLDILPYDGTLAGPTSVTTTVFVGNADVENETTETIPMAETVTVDFNGHVWGTNGRATVGWIVSGSDDITDECTRLNDTAFKTTAEPGSSVTLFYSEYQLRSKSFRITTHPDEEYEITDTHRLVMTEKPAADAEFVVEYQDEPISPLAPISYMRSIDGMVVSMAIDDFSDIEWDDAPEGAKVFETSTGKIHSSDGDGTWTLIDPDTDYAIWSVGDDVRYVYDGSEWIEGDEPGDVTTIGYNRFGFGWAGVTAGMGSLDYDHFRTARTLLRNDPALNTNFLWVGFHTPRLLNYNRRISRWNSVNDEVYFTSADNDTAPPESYDESYGGLKGTIGRVLTNPALGSLANLWEEGAAVVAMTVTGLGEGGNGVIYKTGDSSSGWSLHLETPSSGNHDYSVVFRMHRSGGEAIWQIDHVDMTFDKVGVFKVTVDGDGAGTPVFTFNNEDPAVAEAVAPAGEIVASDGSGTLGNNAGMTAAFSGTIHELYLGPSSMIPIDGHFAHQYGLDYVEPDPPVVPQGSPIGLLLTITQA